MTTVIARTVTRLVVPIILVTAVGLLLQGHNLPGGGFIGAVLASTAFVLVYIIFGLEQIRTVLGADPGSTFDHAPIVWYRTTMALGLLLAVAAGLLSILFGQAFLGQGYVIVHGVPIYGELEIASAVVFDIGVFLTVAGALLTIVGMVSLE